MSTKNTTRAKPKGEPVEGADEKFFTYEGYKFITINARGEKIQVEENLVKKYFKDYVSLMKDNVIYVNYSSDDVHKLLDELNKYEELEDDLSIEKKSLTLMDVVKPSGIIDINFEKELKIYDFADIKIDDGQLKLKRNEKLGNQKHPIVVELNNKTFMYNILVESDMMSYKGAGRGTITFNRAVTIREYITYLLRTDLEVLVKFYPMDK